MIYIVDGCDCSGKTTLANQLVDSLTLANNIQAPLYKGSSFELSLQGSDAMFQHMFSLLKMGEVTGKDMVIDRFYMSNHVYSELFDYPRLSDSQFQLLHHYLNRLMKEDMATVFMVETTLETTLKRYHQRGDEDMNEEMIRLAHRGYENFFHHPWYPSLSTVIRT